MNPESCPSGFAAIDTMQAVETMEDIASSMSGVRETMAQRPSNGDQTGMGRGALKVSGICRLAIIRKDLSNSHVVSLAQPGLRRLRWTFKLTSKHSSDPSFLIDVPRETSYTA